MNPTTDLQTRLFEIIESRYERRTDAVDSICRILSLSRDPVYRRMRGESLLTPQEITLLAAHYNLSIDRIIFGSSSKLVCTFRPLSNRVRNFADYLTEFTADFEMIRRLPNAHMFNASSEIPVLACTYFPQLVAFKLYIWGRNTWDFEYLRNRPFSFDLVDEPVERLIHAVRDHYTLMDSTELLSVNTIDMTLSQIEYHLYSHAFANERDAIKLCELLLQWIAHMKAMAESERKYDVGSSPSERSAKFRLYHNEIFYTTNITMVKSDLGPASYFTYNGPNFMRTTDEKFCQFTQEWFDQVMGKSAHLGQASERTREWFFRELTKKVERVRQRLEVYLDDAQ
jgi:hypothetical protein